MEKSPDSEQDAILYMVTRGMTNIEIGKELFMSPDTVKNRVSRLYATYGVNKRRDLKELSEKNQLALVGIRSTEYFFSVVVIIGGQERILANRCTRDDAALIARGVKAILNATTIELWLKGKL